MKHIIKRAVMTLAAAAVIVFVALALRPKPVEVEAARAVNGSLQVTIDEDGETRAHDRFTLAAPIAGRLSRIEFHEPKNGSWEENITAELFVKKGHVVGQGSGNSSPRG